jgi:hypothetical protein
MTDGIPRYWWLSFVDRTHDEHIGDDVAIHLGVALVTATSFDDAVREAWTYRINPGGEVAGQPIGYVHRVFRDGRDRRRFTYQLLEGADIGEAQLAIERETTAGAAADCAETICWNTYCRKHHDGARRIGYGRCRSGRRWFWFTVHFGPGRGYDADWNYIGHCDDPVCHYGGAHEYGWEDTEATATAAAVAAVTGLAEGQRAVPELRQGLAYDALKRINAANADFRSGI